MSNVIKLNADRIKVELVQSNVLTRWPCHCCGGTTDKVNVLAEVKGGEHDGFRVCETCLQAGDIPERIQRRADQLEAEAATLRQMAGRLDVPTYAQWQQAVRDYDEAYVREVYGVSLEEYEATTADDRVPW